MLNKKPKSQFTGAFKKGFKAVILFETACIGGAYWIWHRANSSREYRYYLHQNIPWVLNFYYSTGELFDSKYSVRSIDQEVWNKEGRKV